jgi:hypothetical protein
MQFFSSVDENMRFDALKQTNVISAKVVYSSREEQTTSFQAQAIGTQASSP